MRKLLFASGLLLVALVVLVVRAPASRGDVATAPALPSVGVSEPITGTAVTGPPAANAGPAHAPFTPYPIGPVAGDTSPKPFWTYDDLTAEQKAVIDAAREDTEAQATHDAFSAAASELGRRAAGTAAQHQLGVDNLGTTGVIP